MKGQHALDTLAHNVSSACCPYLPISFPKEKCLVGGLVIFIEILIAPLFLHSSILYYNLKPADSSSWLAGSNWCAHYFTYLPPSPLTASMGANGNVFLITMRQGQNELPRNEILDLSKCSGRAL